MSNGRSIAVFICAILFLVPSSLSASENEHAEHAQKEKFNPGAYMFDHIKDAYDWHIISIKEKHISIPLPIILYSKQQGLVAFMSNKFHHGHSAYKGFRIAQEGEHQGKIEEILSDGSIILPLDLSFTKNIAALFFSLIILLLIFIPAGKMYKTRPNKAPSGMQSFIEPVILFIRDEIAKPSIGAKKHEKFMPYLLSVFFFIWINNMLGLIPIFPGGANVTGNISITLVLALFTFTITNLNGNRTYWQHIVNMPGVPVWLKIPIPLMPLVETIGVISKPFVLMVRLFANITAGHIIALGFLTMIFLFGEIKPVLGYTVSVVSVAFIIFMTFLELLVAFIQAYVFTFLSALYIGMAVEEHH